jgi:hypothetical protein
LPANVQIDQNHENYHNEYCFVTLKFPFLALIYNESDELLSDPNYGTENMEIIFYNNAPLSQLPEELASIIPFMVDPI